MLPLDPVVFRVTPPLFYCFHGSAIEQVSFQKSFLQLLAILLASDSAADFALPNSLPDPASHFSPSRPAFTELAAELGEQIYRIFADDQDSL